MHYFHQLLGGVAAIATLSMSVTVPAAQFQTPTIVAGGPSNTSVTPPEFTKLQQLLATQNWQAADVETRRLVQQWVYPKGDLYAVAKVEAISCTNLQTLDTLWTKASQGRFGYSTQQKLWQNPTNASRSEIESFGKRLGWTRTKPLTDAELPTKWFASTWLTEPELNFTMQAPAGHLPWNGIAYKTVLSLTQQSGAGCGSCNIDALYLQEERNYRFLPAFYGRVKTCLATNVSTDYSALQSALAAGNWREANRLTSNAILELAGQKQRGYLIATDTRKLSCQELKKIDQLWKQHSNGRFGLSIQSQIWQGLKGKTYEDSLRFEKAVGWNRTQPVFDVKTAPKGHLPLRPALSEGLMNSWGGGWIPEISGRMKSCGN